MFKLNCFKFKHFLFVAISLILNFRLYEFNNNVHHQFSENISATNLFRFRNFEPRNVIRTNAELKAIVFDNLVQNIRKPRGFQFHASDQDFNIDLDIIMPFIRIPIQRSISVTHTAFRSLFNLNLQSLLITGAIVAIGGIFAIILKVIFSSFLYINSYKQSRNEDVLQYESVLYNQYPSRNDTHKVNQLTIESKLLENNINITQCIQRFMCNYVQENFGNRNSKAGGLLQIMDGVLSLKLVRCYLNGTATQNALDTANRGDNCNVIYSGCNWTFSKNKILQFLAKTFNLNIL